MLRFKFKNNFITSLFGRGNVVGSVPVLTVITRTMHRSSSYITRFNHINMTKIHRFTPIHHARSSVVEAYNRHPSALEGNPLNVLDKNGFPHVEGVHLVCSKEDCLTRVCLSPCAKILKAITAFHLTSATTDEHLSPKEKEKKTIQTLNKSKNFKGQNKAQGAAEYKEEISVDVDNDLTKNIQATEFVKLPENIDRVHNIVKNKS
jgi:hypothetical protein